MKTCSKCKNEYPATLKYWFKGENCRSGLRGICKNCCTIIGRENRKKNTNKYNPHPGILKTCVKCNDSFPATDEFWFKSSCGKYGLRSKCKKCFQIESKKNKLKPSYVKKDREYKKRHYKDNREYYVAKWRAYYIANAEHLKEKSREYSKANRDKLRKMDAKRRGDLQFRICSNLSRNIRQSLYEKRSKNGAHWEILVGYTRQDLIKHIEKKFKPGMTWENYGKWHLDHVIPKSVFNFTDVNHIDFKRCWALKNLQPLWAKENMSKQNKLEKPFQPSLPI